MVAKARRVASRARPPLLEPVAMLVLVMSVLVVVSAACAAVTAVCFAIALYELLNGEARTLRLDASLLLPAIVSVAVESAALTAGILLLPFGWLAPRRAVSLSKTSNDARERPPLVLVPTWPLGALSLAILRRRLRNDGWPDVVVARLPLRGDLAAAARALASAVDAACGGDASASVMLVAHGTGGVVCRAYLRWLGGLGRTTKLVTLATPHQGSKLYALALGGLPHDLRPESDALAELAAEDPIPAAVDCTAIYSSFDVTIVPSRLAYYAGAGNIEVEGAGHFTMPWSRRVYELLRENLEYVAAPPMTGSGASPAA